MKITKAYVKQINEAKTFDKPVVTEIGGKEKFWPAEAYHQNYFARNTFLYEAVSRNSAASYISPIASLPYQGQIAISAIE